MTLKVRAGLASLRSPALFGAVREALAAGKERFGFRLVHFSVQRDHLHLLAEAEDRRALERGVQGLSIRIAKAINRELGCKGRVFADRYHSRILKTPRECWFALRYVLLNARKHERGADRLPAGFIDGCSSAAWLAEGAWQRPAELVFGIAKCRRAWAARGFFGSPRRSSSESPVAAARSWLLRLGYRRAGPLDVDAEPHH